MLNRINEQMQHTWWNIHTYKPMMHITPNIAFSTLIESNFWIFSCHTNKSSSCICSLLDDERSLSSHTRSTMMFVVKRVSVTYAKCVVITMCVVVSQLHYILVVLFTATTNSKLSRKMCISSKSELNNTHTVRKLMRTELETMQVVREAKNKLGCLTFGFR